MCYTQRAIHENVFYKMLLCKGSVKNLKQRNNKKHLCAFLK